MSKFVEFYNSEYPHSMLGYRSPDDVKAIWEVVRHAA